MIKNPFEKNFFQKLLNEIDNSLSYEADINKPYILYILKDKENDELVWVLALPDDEKIYNKLRQIEVSEEIEDCDLYVSYKDDEIVEITNDKKSFRVTIFQLANQDEINKYLERFEIKAVKFSKPINILESKNITIFELDYTDEFTTETKEGVEKLIDINNNIKDNIIEKLKCTIE